MVRVKAQWNKFIFLLKIMAGVDIARGWLQLGMN
jgi:hypothetical protein